MAGEDSTDPSRRGHEAASVPDISISPVSQKLQTVGQRILSNKKLVEVAENIFSTCPVPLKSLSDRLMLARDFAAPLVEASVFPQTDQYAAIRQQFGVSSRLVKGITWSDGRQRDAPYMLAHIRYDIMSLVIYENMAVGLDQNKTLKDCGYSDKEIRANIISRYYNIKDSTHRSLGMADENYVIYGFEPTDDLRIDLELDHALEELDKFDAARTPDGYWR